MGQTTSSLGVAVGVFYVVLPLCGVLNMIYTVPVSYTHLLDALRTQRQLVRKEIRRLQMADRRLTRKLEEWERVLPARPGQPFWEEKAGQYLSLIHI